MRRNPLNIDIIYHYFRLSSLLLICIAFILIRRLCPAVWAEINLPIVVFIIYYPKRTILPADAITIILFVLYGSFFAHSSCFNTGQTKMNIFIYWVFQWG